MLVQGSLLDLGAGVAPRPSTFTTARIELGKGAWIEVIRSWLCGADELFARLAETVPWRAERRWMYERMVDVPRLVAHYGEGDELPDPALTVARDELSRRYLAELGEPFRTVGLCSYRDGRDSVAWHSDTIGRGSNEDTLVAIVSLGATRRLSIRPSGGGPSRRFDLGGGDLFVMGGSCQRTFEHAVLKTNRPVGARISVQFRPRGVA